MCGHSLGSGVAALLAMVRSLRKTPSSHTEGSMECMRIVMGRSEDVSDRQIERVTR